MDPITSKSETRIGEYNLGVYIDQIVNWIKASLEAKVN